MVNILVPKQRVKLQCLEFNRLNSCQIVLIPLFVAGHLPPRPVSCPPNHRAYLCVLVSYAALTKYCKPVAYNKHMFFHSLEGRAQTKVSAGLGPLEALRKNVFQAARLPCGGCQPSLVLPGL